MTCPPSPRLDQHTDGGRAEKTQRTWGTHFGLTKLPDSTQLNPDIASLSIRAALMSAASAVVSFCSPSRGPTSTILTMSEILVEAFLRRQCDNAQYRKEEAKTEVSRARGWRSMLRFVWRHWSSSPFSHYKYPSSTVLFQLVTNSTVNYYRNFGLRRDLFGHEHHASSHPQLRGRDPSTGPNFILHPLSRAHVSLSSLNRTPCLRMM